MYLSTYGVTCDELKGVLKDLEPVETNLIPDLYVKIRSRTGSRKAERRADDDESVLKQFFADIPKVPSHYCRQKTQKLYLN